MIVGYCNLKKAPNMYLTSTTTVHKHVSTMYVYCIVVFFYWGAIFSVISSKSVFLFFFFFFVIILIIVRVLTTSPPHPPTGHVEEHLPTENSHPTKRRKNISCNNCYKTTSILYTPSHNYCIKEFKKKKGIIELNYSNHLVFP